MAGRSDQGRKLAEQVARGGALLDASDPGAARKVFETALRRNAASYEAQLGLARALFDLGEADAEAAFARAATLAPDRAEPLLWQVRVLNTQLEASPDAAFRDGELLIGHFEKDEDWDRVCRISRLLDEAVARAPGDPDARLQRGLWLEQAGASYESDTGILDLRLALEARPRDPAMQRAVGIGLIRAGELFEGVDLLTRLEAEHGPLDEVALRVRAEALSSWLNEDARAEADLRALVRMNPAHGDDHRALAQLLKKQGRIEETIPIWRHVLTLAQPRSEDCRALARALLSLTRYAEAEVVCTDGIAAWPKDNCLYMLRGNARLHQDDAEGARQDYDRALELNAGCTAALLNRGSLRGREGDAEGKLADWLRVLDKDPRNASAHQHLADHFLNTKMWAQCMHHARAALSRNLNNAWARAMLGRARFELGEGEAALDDLDRAVHDGPTIAAVLNQRGIVLGKLGQTERQIEDCRIALQHAPGDTGILYNLGVRLAQSGAAAEAFDIFDDLVSRRDNVSDRRWRGECHRLSGRLPEAIADFEQALSMEGVSDEDAAWIAEKLAATQGS